MRECLFGTIMALAFVFVFAHLCGVETSATDTEMMIHFWKSIGGIVVLFLAEIGGGFI